MGLLRGEHHRALASMVDEGMPARHGASLLEQRDRLEPGPRAVVILYLAANAIDCDGFSAAYTDLDLPVGELVWAARHVGTRAHAELLHDVERSIPAHARQDPHALYAFVLDNDELFEAFGAEYYALEDSGDVLLEHLIRYTLERPLEFDPYRSPLADGGDA